MHGEGAGGRALGSLSAATGTSALAADWRRSTRGGPGGVFAFIFFSCRRKLAERTEASVQVSEFNVSCKGEISMGLSRASAVLLGQHCPPTADSLTFTVSALDLWAECSCNPLTWQCCACVDVWDLVQVLGRSWFCPSSWSPSVPNPP